MSDLGKEIHDSVKEMYDSTDAMSDLGQEIHD